jgi:hypothetical protein
MLYSRCQGAMTGVTCPMYYNGDTIYVIERSNSSAVVMGIQISRGY